MLVNAVHTLVLPTRLKVQRQGWIAENKREGDPPRCPTFRHLKEIRTVEVSTLIKP
jgi:hypothetical protein